MSGYGHIPGLHSANATPLGQPPNGASPYANSADPMSGLESLLAENRPPQPTANGNMYNGGLQVQTQGIQQQQIPIHEQNGQPAVQQPVPIAQPVAQMHIKQENSAPTPPQAADDPNFEVPACLLYSGEGSEDDQVIPKPRLAQLPQDVLLNMLKEGESMGNIHNFGPTPNFQSLRRLKQYLEKGDYQPFNPQTPLEYLDATGTAHEWAARLADSPNAVEVPKATHELFLREIDLYLYAAKIGYTELRRISAERLCSRYPKSVHSIWALIDRVATVAAQNQDQGLMKCIVGYINANCKELTGLPEYLPLLRKLTRGRPPLGPVLLEAYISSSDAARRELKLGYKVAGAGDATPKTPVAPAQQIMAPTGPAANAGPPTSPFPTSFPPSRRHAHNHPTFNAPFPAHEIPNLVEALQRQCLVVANDNGYGTLVKDGRRNVRNTEFKFLKGELLTADRYADTVNGRHNVLVMNARGEIGDILRTLVKKVPAGLGVLSQDASVNAGNPPNTGHGRISDREQRTFHPPGGGYSNHRGRSRSPMRRY
ncbi:4-hydroxyphenylpyruvate dioxygenase [Venturia nashicola]|nr:4-hydroxyphenylpyruvate dioxygenase [Venturia nashicola]